LHSGNIEKKKIINSSQEIVCGLLHFEDKITLLGGSKRQKLFNFQLFQLNEAQDSMTWQPLSMPQLSTNEFDPDNCICTECKDGIIAISLQQPQLYAASVTQDSVFIHFHIFLSTTKKWKSAWLPFSHLRPPKNSVFRMQSCAANSRSLYYSVLYNSQVHVYHIYLEQLLRTETYDEFEDDNGIQPLPNSASNLIKTFVNPVKQCFISFLNTTPISVVIKDNVYRSIMEVESLSPSSSLKIHYCHQFTSFVKVVMARMILKTKDSICIVFHDSKAKKCYLKTLNILSNKN